MEAKLEAMKTIVAAFFVSCVVSLAQPTNVDPSTGMLQWPADGKITDTNLFAPISFTNSIGDFITDAIPARIVRELLPSDGHIHFKQIMAGAWTSRW
jgi:hypothetical protein